MSNCFIAHSQELCTEKSYAEQGMTSLLEVLLALFIITYKDKYYCIPFSFSWNVSVNTETKPY